MKKIPDKGVEKVHRLHLRQHAQGGPTHRVGRIWLGVRRVEHTQTVHKERPHGVVYAWSAKDHAKHRPKEARPDLMPSRSEGLPHVGVDPAGTSADCLKCGGKLKRSGAPSARNERNMWCQPCRMIRERDANAGANILFRAIWQLLEDAGHIGAAGGGRRQCRFRGAA